MVFGMRQLSQNRLEDALLKADRKKCRRFGPCGVGDQALYLNSYFLDRYYAVPICSVRRAFKRIAMSKGGFTGKGAFGAIPYLVVEYDDHAQLQCTFRREEEVDQLLAYLEKKYPEIPRVSTAAAERLRVREEQEANRYLKELTPEAEAAKKKLERAEKFLKAKPEIGDRLSEAAKAKRSSDRTHPAYKWVALVIVLAGIAALLYGLYTVVTGNQTGIYFALFGFAAIFFFSGAQILPTAKNNRHTITREWEAAKRGAEEYVEAFPSFPVPGRYAHPVVLERMIRIIREGRAETCGQALEVLKADLKALNSSVQVEESEYNEVVAIKPIFLLCEYQ